MGAFDGAALRISLAASFLPEQLSRCVRVEWSTLLGVFRVRRLGQIAQDRIQLHREDGL